ncbi:uncharacterized protein G2W53_017042 [Senna tora]|uniref:Uncharacterized protein n=1 Tax=Senna tora TaxID=362788 RepID=A0A834TP83_9FABA|nr:uncharacterized protein G2W53_017042 [Senna tora]
MAAQDKDPKLKTFGFWGTLPYEPQVAGGDHNPLFDVWSHL